VARRRVRSRNSTLTCTPACAIRSSVVLGFVGAGGLGQQLDNSTKMFAGGEVATMLLVFVALVALADRTSGWLRRALA